jgi:hypothetical protein
MLSSAFLKRDKTLRLRMGAQKGKSPSAPEKGTVE